MELHTIPELSRYLLVRWERRARAIKTVALGVRELAGDGFQPQTRASFDLCNAKVRQKAVVLCNALVQGSAEKLYQMIVDFLVPAEG